MDGSHCSTEWMGAIAQPSAPPPRQLLTVGRVDRVRETDKKKTGESRRVLGPPTTCDVKDVADQARSTSRLTHEELYTSGATLQVTMTSKVTLNIAKIIRLQRLRFECKN